MTDTDKTTTIEIGTNVLRVARAPFYDGTERGVIIDSDAARVQIQWERDIAGKPRKGWMQRKAEGKRWVVA